MALKVWIAGEARIGGMICCDARTPQGQYQHTKRERYCRLFNLPEDGPDCAFWRFCDECEHKLADRLLRLGLHPKARDVITLLRTP